MSESRKEAARQRLELRRAQDACGFGRTQPSESDYSTGSRLFAWMLVAAMAAMFAMVVSGVVM